MKRHIKRYVILLATLLTPTLAEAANPYTIEWGLQFGPNYLSGIAAIDFDAFGNAIVAGGTEGSLGGPNAGSTDIFLRKYDPTGSILWTRQLGSADFDGLDALATDALGNAYVTGRTEGALGGPFGGFSDAFIAKYDPSGALAWTRQFGDASFEQATAVTVDSAGNILVSGATNGVLGDANLGLTDAFVRKYDTAGNVIWTKQFGTAGDDVVSELTADALGNIYTSGGVRDPALPIGKQTDAVVTKLDSAGNLVWVRQFGSTTYDHFNDVVVPHNDGASEVVIDSDGNIVVLGHTDGFLGPGPGINWPGYDVFLRKYDSAGTELWTARLAANTDVSGTDLDTHPNGGVVLSGYTWGNLDGQSAGHSDIILAHYDSAGTQIWVHQMGTNQADYNSGVGFDPFGNLFLVGHTYGSLVAPNPGGPDPYVIKYAAVPEPTSVSLLAAAMAGFAVIVRRKRRSS